MKHASALVALAVVLVGCSSPPSPTPTTSAPTSASPSPSPTTASPTPTPTPTPAVTIDQAMFGIHSFQGPPQTRSGSIRLNCSPLWRDIETARGQFDWAAFDAAVSRAEDWGFTDIVYSFCGTPTWAGRPVPDPSVEVFGPGSTSAPARMSYFEDFAAAVVQRYRGRITAYEVWNEPTSRQFFAGTPRQAAEMTAILHDVVTSNDPDALVLSAGVQTHRPDTWAFITDYVDALRAAEWPVDVWNAHFYPTPAGTPLDAGAQVERFRDILAAAGAPAHPLWNTEVNYDVGMPGGDPDGRITGSQAAAWTAQTYLYALEWGIARTYWYLWTQSYYGFPGIQTRPGDPATAVLSNLSRWLTGAEFAGCSRDATVVSCRFDADTPFTVTWAESGSARVPVPSGTTACDLVTGACTTAPSPLTLDDLPVLIR